MTEEQLARKLSDGVPGSTANEVPIPDGLARATIWLPLRDALPLPEGSGILLGDELPELDGQPILVVGDDGDVVAIPDSQGHAPVEVRIWRIEGAVTGDSGFAAAQACVASGLVHQSWNLPAQLEAVETTQVVVQVTFVIRKVNDTYFQGPILEQGVEFVQRLQTAYNMLIGGPPAELLTQEQLPLLIPVVISAGPPEPLRPGNVMTFAPLPMASSVERFDRSHLTPTQLLGHEDLRKLMMLAGGLPAQVGLPVQQFRTDARMQLHRYGNYRQSIIASAAAAESLLFTMYQMFLWEEGMSPAAAADKLSRVESILKRAKREMSPRVGGTWDEHQPGPVANWANDVLRVRNLIVHAGHAATRTEALRAMESLNSFVAMFADRFAQPSVLSRHPKTGILAVPKASFESRGAWSERLQQLFDEHYAEWWHDLLSWQAQLESLLQV